MIMGKSTKNIVRPEGKDNVNVYSCAARMGIWL